MAEHETPATTWRKFYIRRGDPLDDGICTSYNELGDRCVLPVAHAVDHSAGSEVPDAT